MNQKPSKLDARPTVTPLTADDRITQIDWLDVVGTPKTKLCAALRLFDQTFAEPDGEEGADDNNIEELIG